jgi:hypothetical protein
VVGDTVIDPSPLETEVTAPAVPFDAEVILPLTSTVIVARVYNPAATPVLERVEELLPDGIETSPVIAALFAITAPVVGLIVNVPSVLLTDVTPAGIAAIAFETAKVVGYLVLSGDASVVALFATFSGVNPNAFCLLLNVVQFAELKYPSVVPLA